MINDYPYVRMDGRNDGDLVLPQGVQWDAIGKFSEKCDLVIFLFRFLNL